ncbi:aldo/keto reductase [Campylobacter cuniculorum]|uniref:aldo/keto reductase n=1 Tax=Campylobacter cuniculorum TaxID=374106 RepID=UPI0023F19821|nr:aldo/keto reductase [Campylobacter cuniculorum]
MKRRDFLKKSAKLAGVLSVLGTHTLFAENGEKMQMMTLNNGVKMPALGLGTYALRGKECERAIKDALECGYRLFDTAQMYANQREIGNAIKQMPRKELFLETKISQNASFSEAKNIIHRALDELQTDYLDLLLIHDNYSRSKEIYEAMQEAYKQGLIKALGISNFNANAYALFIKEVEIMPTINQCQTHLFYQQKALRAAMKETILQSWSPFIAGRKEVFENDLVQNLSKKYGKTPAQIILRFLNEENIALIPKTSRKERMKENLDIFDFTLETQDRENLRKLDQNKSYFSWVD